MIELDLLRITFDLRPEERKALERALREPPYSEATCNVDIELVALSILRWGIKQLIAGQAETNPAPPPPPR